MPETLRVTKSKLKWVRSLHQKKEREAQQLFICEGPKLIHEALSAGWTPHMLLTTEPEKWLSDKFPVYSASPSELQQASTLTTANEVLAIFAQPPAPAIKNSKLALYCDDLNDPGNLGTLIRLCDWYGIKQLFLRPGSVSPWHPKVVQASMGSIFRIDIRFVEPLELHKACDPACLWLGADLSGTSIYSFAAKEKPIMLVLGSESHGISAGVARFLHQRVHIPRKGQGESLNVAIAAAILCDRLLNTPS